MTKARNILYAWAFVILTSATVSARPDIVHPNAVFKGKTAGEWTEAWWQWVDGTERNVQMYDATGEFAHVNDNGKDGVFFLAKSWVQDEDENYGVPQERHVTIPAGTPLYVPVMGLRDFESVETGDSNVLWDRLIADLPNSRDLSVSINGIQVAGLDDGNDYYLNYTDINSVFHPDSGVEFLLAGYEFSFIVKPLPPGNHVIEMKGKGGGGFETNVTYYITVEPRKGTSLYSNIPEDCCDDLFVSGKHLSPHATIHRNAQPFKSGESGTISVRVPMAKVGSPKGVMRIEIWDDNGGRPGRNLATLADIELATLAPAPNGGIISFEKTISGLDPNAVHYVLFDHTRATTLNADNAPSYLATRSNEGTFGSGTLLGDVGTGWRPMTDFINVPFGRYMQIEVIEPSVEEVVSNDLIIATTEGGTISGSTEMEKYPAGTEVTVTAQPEEGFEFVKWTYGEQEFTTNPATITVKEGATLTPVFAKQEAEPIGIDIVPAMAIRWDSQSGKTYEIQLSTDLENWTVEAEGIEGTGETSTYFFVRNTSEIYYRVAETQ